MAKADNSNPKPLDMAFVEDADSIFEKTEIPSNKNLGTNLKESGDYDPKLQRKLLLKLDMIVLPTLSLIYFFSSMVSILAYSRC